MVLKMTPAHKIPAFAAAALLWPGGYSAVGPRVAPDLPDVQLIDCYDGDTCRFQVGSETVKIRVRGVNTPEIKGECPEEIQLARSARGFVLWHLKRAKRIDLVNREAELYGRYAADVIVDGKNLHRLILKKGRGRPYDAREKRKPWCLEEPQ